MHTRYDSELSGVNPFLDKVQDRCFWYIFVPNFILVLIAAVVGLLSGDISELFREGALMTWWSMAQMLMIALVALLIFRKLSVGLLNFRNSGYLWLIISLGFVFLAADEIYAIHEGIDRSIHAYLHLQETPLSDRIDDFLVGLYGAVAVGLLYCYRNEIKRYPGLVSSLFVTGSCIGLMVILDLATNDEILFTWLLGDRLGPVVTDYVAFAEDCCKILAQSLFLTSFCRVFQSLSHR